jgi:histidine triad (HIT) family protein
MDACLFCKIAAGKIPAAVVEQDADLVAFRDIQPQAPVHLLVIPRRHLGSLVEAGEADAGLLGRMLDLARRLAEREKVATTGYRTVINVGKDGGQSVGHLHLHLLGGRGLGWPPG